MYGFAAYSKKSYKFKQVSVWSPVASIATGDSRDKYNIMLIKIQYDGFSRDVHGGGVAECGGGALAVPRVRHHWTVTVQCLLGCVGCTGA